MKRSVFYYNKTLITSHNIYASVNIPVSHVDPVTPVGHTQENMLICGVEHVPPWWHGLDKHSSMSGKQTMHNCVHWCAISFIPIAGWNMVIIMMLWMVIILLALLYVFNNSELGDDTGWTNIRRCLENNRPQLCTLMCHKLYSDCWME